MSTGDERRGKNGAPGGRQESGVSGRARRQSQLCALLPQVISDGVPLVLALVPHRQSHSFTIQGSSDLLVSAPRSPQLSSTPALTPPSTAPPLPPLAPR